MVATGHHPIGEGGAGIDWRFMFNRMYESKYSLGFDAASISGVNPNCGAAGRTGIAIFSLGEIGWTKGLASNFCGRMSDLVMAVKCNWSGRMWLGIMSSVLIGDMRMRSGSI